MSRQTQINSFNDGLNKDFNPLLTPNTVMTDCLNGTIVTYNGNEFALQNDLGNYKFKYGSLDPGFVPVGIKEHANILYIISYNPIEDKVEIGSFPSMRTIYGSKVKNSTKSTVINVEDGKIYNYTDLSKESQLTLISPIDEDYKLNSGDMYILKRTVDNKDYDDSLNIINANSIWQHTGAFVFTENKTLYNIDGLVNWHDGNDETVILQQFKYVKWDIPGWIAVKPIVNVMDEFNCYVDDIKYNDGINRYINIKIQSIWPTNVYNNVIEDISKVLKYKSDIDGTNIKYSDNKIVAYNDIYTIIQSSIELNNDNESKFIKIAPYLDLTGCGNDIPKIKIIYDQFETELSLEIKSWDHTDVSIGSDIFRYYVDEYKAGSDHNLILSLDVNAPYNTNLLYRFLRYENNELKEVLKRIETDVVINGQNILEFKFGEGNFNKEDYYKLEIYAYPEGFDPSEGIVDYYNNNKEFIIYKKEFDIFASEYSNYYYRLYDNYDSDEFKLDEKSFIEAIERCFRIKNIINNNNSFSHIVKMEDNIISDINSELNNTYKDMPSNSIDIEDFDEFRKHIYSGTRYTFGKDIKLDYPLDQKGVKGRLWEDAKEPINIEVKYIDSDDNYKSIEYDKDNYYLDVLNDYFINISTTHIDKVYPESSDNYVPMYDDSFIKKEDNNTYRYIKSYFVKKSKNDNNGYDYGYCFGKDGFKVKVDNDEITLISNANTVTTNYFNGKWQINKTALQPSNWFDTNSVFNLDDNDGTKDGDDIANCAKEVNKLLKYPAFINFTSERDKNWNYFFEMNYSYNKEYHCGYRHPSSLQSTWEGAYGDLNETERKKRHFDAIAIAGEQGEPFFILLPGEIQEDDIYGYFWGQFFTFMTMIANIKWCKKNETNRYYIPKLYIESNYKRNIEIKEIDYYYNIEYNYPNKDGFLNDLNDTRFETTSQINIVFGNQSHDEINGKNVNEHILEFAEDKNIELSKAKSVFDFDEVTANTMFIDRNYNGEFKHILNKLKDMITFKNNKFKLIYTNSDYNLKMRSDGKKYNLVCKVSPDYYEN